MIIDKLTGLKVEVRERNIGAAHDPYGETEVALSLPNGDHATYLYNGLGLNRATFYSELNGPEPGREFTWYFQCEVDHPAHKEKMAEADAIAKQVFGVTFGEAYEHYCENYEEDPFGPASRYI